MGEQERQRKRRERERERGDERGRIEREGKQWMYMLIKFKDTLQDNYVYYKVNTRNI